MIGALRRLVPEFVRRSYVLKFGITLLILGLAVGAIGFVATGQIQQEVKAGVNNDLGSSASQEAEAFDQWNQRNKLVLQNLAESEAATSANSQRMQTFIDQRINNTQVTPDGVAIHYVDTSTNTVVASTEDGVRGNSLQGLPTPWARQLAGSNPSGIDVYTAHFVDQTPVLTYAMNAEGLESRVVVYEVNLSAYQSAAQREEGSFVYVVENTRNQSGSRQIIYDSSGQRFFQKYSLIGILNDARNVSASAPPSERVRGPFAPPTGLAASAPEEYSGGNEKYIASYAQVGDSNFTVIVHTPQSQAYGFVSNISRAGFLATLAGVLLIGVVGAVLGRNTATAIDRLRKKSEEMEQGNLDVDFEHERIDNIGRLYDGMANMRDALRNQIVEAREAREEAELAREEAEQTSRHLQAKANEYRDVMQAVAAGDLGQRMRPSDRNEAMREIAEEFNSMIAEIEATIRQLKDFANEVATSSEEVTASAEEVRSASQQVTRSIQEISEGAERQNDSLQSVSREMSGLSTTVEEIASLSNEVADLSERTAETGRRGREAAQEAIAGMNQIEEESEEAVDQIEQLESEMQQVDDLIEFITDVANQTNMLALNANIEASRAGSGSGDAEGFAVVANEVKELAEETKNAAEDIESRLERIQDQTEDTVESVRTTGERIAENTESVRNAVEALDEIAGYAQETNTGVQEISAATEEQAASTEEVVAMVDEAATISEKTSQEAENVAAAAEEQTTAMTEVSDSASDLSQQASRLSEALDRFETGETAAPEAGEGAPPEAADPEPAAEEFPAEGVEGEGMPAGVEELADEFDDEALEAPDAETGDVGAEAGGLGGDAEPAEAAPEEVPGEEEAPATLDDLAEDVGELPDEPGTEPEPEGEVEELDDAALEDIAGEAGGDSLGAEFDEGDLEPGETADSEAGPGGEFEDVPDEAPEADLEPPAEEAEPADADDVEPPAEEADAGIGDLAADDVEDVDLEEATGGPPADGSDTLGGTEPATFGDVSDGGGDPDDEDMFSFVDDGEPGAEADADPEPEEQPREGDDD